MARSRATSAASRYLASWTCETSSAAAHLSKPCRRPSSGIKSRTLRPGRSNRSRSVFSYSLRLRRRNSVRPCPSLRRRSAAASWASSWRSTASVSSPGGRFRFGGGMAPPCILSWTFTQAAKAAGSLRFAVSVSRSRPPFFVWASWQRRQCFSRKERGAGVSAARRTADGTRKEQASSKPVQRRRGEGYSRLRWNDFIRCMRPISEAGARREGTGRFMEYLTGSGQRQASFSGKHRWGCPKQARDDGLR